MKNSPPNPSAAKRNLYIIIIIMTIASFAFRIIGDYHLEQTSILFIGLPAFIAFLLVKYTTTPKNTYFMVFRVITLFLLISFIFLGEGTACVIFMAPLFYGVGAVITFIYEFARKRGKSNLSSIVILPLLFVIAQPFELKTKPPLQTIDSSVIVNRAVTLDELNLSPNFMNNYPTFFKLGFPKPIDIEGAGTSINDYRTIDFLSSTKGVGQLTLKVVERTESTITFQPIEDNTHIDHWLTWKRITVQLTPLENNRTEVNWTTTYQCDLGPSWYFLPFENYAVDIMNKHLINAYFLR